MNEPEKAKQSLARRKLLEDILGVNMHPDFAGQPVECNARLLVDTCFQDVTYSTWCSMVGLRYKLNFNPLPEFRCPTTIIFYPIPHLELEDYCNDEL